MLENKNILVLEDEVDLKNALKKYIQERKCNVFEAMDTEEALKSIEENHIDLVLLDVMLPKKSGLDILEDIRKVPDHINLPIIVLTNLADYSYEKDAYAKGASFFFVKAQTSLELLVSKVDELINIK